MSDAKRDELAGSSESNAALQSGLIGKMRYDATATGWCVTQVGARYLEQLTAVYHTSRTMYLQV
jgi:hypothetical protein